MIIIYIYYHIFMNLYILLMFFFVDFTLRITLQCVSETATEAFPWTGKILRESQPIN